MWKVEYVSTFDAFDRPIYPSERSFIFVYFSSKREKEKEEEDEKKRNKKKKKGSMKVWKKLSRRRDKIGCLLGFRLQIGKLYALWRASFSSFFANHLGTFLNGVAFFVTRRQWRKTTCFVERHKFIELRRKKIFSYFSLNPTSISSFVYLPYLFSIARSPWLAFYILNISSDVFVVGEWVRGRRGKKNKKIKKKKL